METIVKATGNLRELADDPATEEKISEQWMSEIVADKGYHSNQTLLDMQEINLRPYISEPTQQGPIKTFTLSGIKESPPYFHDGRLLTLEDTVEFFNLVLELKLNPEEKTALVAFMRQL